MSDLTIGLHESKKQKNHCRVVITCSPDQKESVEDLIITNFKEELANSGIIKEDDQKFRLQFILKSPEKIMALRAAIMEAFMRHTNLANFNEN